MGRNRLTVNNIEELQEKLKAIQEELHKLPNKERDYTEYRKVYMRLKYRLDEESRAYQQDKANNYYHNVVKSC